MLAVEFTPVVIANILFRIISFITGGLAVVWLYRNSEKRGAKWMALFTALGVLTSLFTLARLVLPLEPTAFIYYVRQTTTAYVVVAWVLFAVTYSGLDEKVGDYFWWVFGISMLFVLVVRFTSTTTHLSYVAQSVRYSPIVIQEYQTGILGVAVAIEVMLWAYFGAGAVIYHMVKSKHVAQWQAFTFFVVSQLTLFGFAVNFFSTLPGVFTEIKYSGAGIAYSIPIFILSAYRANIFTTDPVDKNTIIESTTDAVIVIDPEYGISEYNAAAEELFTTTGREVVTMMPEEVLPDEIASLPAVKNFTDGEAEVELTDGATTTGYKVTVSKISESTLHQGIVVTLSDISELKQRENQLETTNEQLEQFANFVSHDLRNPLSAATMYTEELTKRYDDEEIEVVRESLERMDEMIEDVREFAKEGSTATELEDVSLERIAEDTWRLAETEDATLVVEDDLQFRGDPDKLRNLLGNLFRNAVDHGSDDATVAVVPFQDGSGFAVEDDGPGLPEDKEHEVFDEGFSTGGTGFGLAIVERIAEAHGWTVNAANGTEYGGARIEVTFD